MRPRVLRFYVTFTSAGKLLFYHAYAICSAHGSIKANSVGAPHGRTRQREVTAANVAKAAKRAAADIEGHSAAAELGQPGRLSGESAPATQLVRDSVARVLERIRPE